MSKIRSYKFGGLKASQDHLKASQDHEERLAREQMTKKNGPSGVTSFGSNPGWITYLLLINVIAASCLPAANAMTGDQHSEEKPTSSVTPSEVLQTSENGEFRLNNTTISDPPVIQGLPNGDFRIAWRENGTIFSETFNPQGEPIRGPISAEQAVDVSAEETSTPKPSM